MRVLFLLQPGTNSRSIFQGMISGFARAGHEALVLELTPFWEDVAGAADRPGAMRRATEVLAAYVRRERVDASVAMWANGLGTFGGGLVGGVPASAFDVLGLPHVAYWLDAPHWAAGGGVTELFRHPIAAGAKLLHVINNEGMAREMTGVLGFGRTLAMPYGVDEEVFRPYDDEPRTYDLVVSAGPGDPAPTPEERRELESDAPDVGALRAARAAGVRVAMCEEARALGEAGSAFAAALLDSQLAGRQVPMLERVAAIVAARPELRGAADTLMTQPKAWVKLTGLARTIDQAERAFTIAWLSRRCRMLVFGAMNTAWEVRAERAGDVPYEDMARWYARGLAGLNIMRWQDDVGVNIKPLEISASGRVCLCGEREGLAALLEPGREVLPVRSPQHALEVLRGLRDEPARALEMGARARAHVEASHAWPSRARTLVDAVRGM